jgi:hypothetical protein
MARSPQNILLPGCLFVLCLLYVVFSAGWYEPAKLVLHGQTTSGNSPLLKVRWDSGQGFNEYEQRLFQPDVQPRDGQVSITIGATGRKAPASLSSTVVCTAILVDGKAIKLHELAAPPVLAGEELHLDHSLSFTVQANAQVSIRFRTNTQAGIAGVVINGTRTEHDLYMANVEAKFKQLDYWLLQPDGSFTVETALPRYPVRELEIMNGNAGTSVVRLLTAELHGKGQVVDLLHGQPVELGSIRFRNVLAGLHSHFQPLQFGQQILFALLSTWLLLALLRLGRAASGLRSCVFVEERQWFWLMLLVSLTVFGTWLAAFWPGVMSVDSMKIWRAALLPDVYLNDHPLLNVILYKYLHHLWDNVAVVPIVQVFLTSLLIAWFAFWIYRQGVRKPVVLLWLLFILSSVPLGVYNTALWKDVPFALLVVFWACILVQLRQEKQQQRLRWTKERSCALLLLGLALGLVRHNGLLYLGVVPALLLLLRLVPLKRALFGLMVLLLAAGLGFAVLRNTHKTTEAGFFTRTMRWYASTVKLENAAQDAKRTMREYLTVLDIDAPQADKFHYYLHDRQAWWFLLHSGWWDVYPYQHEQARFPALNNLALQIYEKSYQQPWRWSTWNPVWLLALLPLLTLCCRWLPNTAILGAMLLAGALPLVYLQIFNWRYYYFLYFGLLFLPAFLSFDLACRKPCASPS